MQVQLKRLPEEFRELFLFAREIGATDVYVKEDSLPFFSVAGVSGKAPFIGEHFGKEVPKKLSRKITRGTVLDFLGEVDVSPKEKEVDFSLEVVNEGKPLGRYRVNLALSFGRVVLSFRRLFHYIPSIDDLLLPQVLKSLKNYSSGLVVVTGPTGSGKSTTLAAVLNFLLEDTEKSRVAVTIEKPIEYVFPDKNGFVIQREVGRDTDSFVSGVYNALRQKPNVLLVGEARTPEEIKAVLTASETGHLTLTTLHTKDAVHTISRMIDVFPENEREAVKTALSETLLLVVSQRLVTTKLGEVRVVCEVLEVTDRIRPLIRNYELQKLKERMVELSREDTNATRLFNDELYKLVVDGVIDKSTAVRVSNDPKRLLERLRNA